MDKAYFKQYYFFERSHWWFKVRLKIIENKLGRYAINKNKSKILNIGVATGQTSLMLNKFGKVTSVENDIETCQFLSEELNINVVHASINQLPFKENTFDIVCAFDVIEHVEDDHIAIHEMYRVCKAGGILFITVPAFMHLWSQHDEINHHFRRYRLKELKHLIESKPGKFIYQSYFNTLLYIPIVIIRTLLNNFPALRRSEKDSDFVTINNPVSNYFAFLIFSFEKLILEFIKMPLGVSIMVLYLKK